MYEHFFTLKQIKRVSTEPIFLNLVVKLCVRILFLLFDFFFLLNHSFRHGFFSKGPLGLACLLKTNTEHMITKLLFKHGDNL